MNKREILLARVKKRKAKKAKASKKAKAKKEKNEMKYPTMSRLFNMEELRKKAEARSDDYKKEPMNDQINEVQPLKWKKAPKGVSAPVNMPMNPNAKPPGEPAEDMPMASLYATVEKVLAEKNCEICGKPISDEKRSNLCLQCAEKERLSLIEQKLSPVQARYPTVAAVDREDVQTRIHYAEQKIDELQKELDANPEHKSLRLEWSSWLDRLKDLKSELGN